MEAQSPPPDPPVRVLLVEDSATDAALVESLLANSPAAQFEVTTAGTLADALGTLARDSPDVVLLDLTLPDSERLDGQRAIRHRSPDVPVVVMTGLQETGLGQAAVQQGAQDFLGKAGVTAERLAETLLFAVARSHQHGAGGLRDPLTGLASGPLLVERVTEALARAERDKRLVAVLVVGLVGFADIDRRFGTLAGEGLLFEVAERLGQAFPPPLPLARIGVDEFAVMVDGLVRPGNAERAGQRALGALAPEFKVGTEKVRLPASVGVALGRLTLDGPALLDRARAAMFDQRRLGQGVRLAPPGSGPTPQGS